MHTHACTHIHTHTHTYTMSPTHHGLVLGWGLLNQFFHSIIFCVFRNYQHSDHGRAVGLPKQHSFCIFSRLWLFAIYIGTHNGVDWWHGRAHAAKRLQFKSPRLYCLRRINTAQTWGNEPWSYHLFTITSMDKAFEVTKEKVRCIKVWWLSSSGLFLSLRPLPLSFDARFVAKNISGRPNTLQTRWHSSIHGNRYMINRIMVLFPTRMPQDFIGVTIIIFRYDEYKQLISTNVFSPVDP